VTKRAKNQGRTSIQELIARSSLGSAAALAIRQQADPELVRRTLARVDALENSHRKPPPKVVGYVAAMLAGIRGKAAGLRLPRKGRL